MKIRGVFDTGQAIVFALVVALAAFCALAPLLWAPQPMEAWIVCETVGVVGFGGCAFGYWRWLSSLARPPLGVTSFGTKVYADPGAAGDVGFVGACELEDSAWFRRRGLLGLPSGGSVWLSARPVRSRYQHGTCAGCTSGNSSEVDASDLAGARGNLGHENGHRLLNANGVPGELQHAWMRENAFPWAGSAP